LFFFRLDGAVLGAAMLPAHCIWSDVAGSISDKNIIPMEPVVLLRSGVIRDLFCFGDDCCFGCCLGDDTSGITWCVATEAFRGEAGEGGETGVVATSVLDPACVPGEPKTSCAAPTSSGGRNICDKLSSGSRLPHELESISSGPGEDLGEEGAAVEAVPSLSLLLEVFLLRILSFFLFVVPPNDLLTTLERNDLVDFVDLMDLSSSSSSPLKWMESSSLCFCLLNKLPMLLLCALA